MSPQSAETLAVIAAGARTAPEVAAALRVSVNHASVVLDRLRWAGEIRACGVAVVARRGRRAMVYERVK